MSTATVDTGHTPFRLRVTPPTTADGPRTLDFDIEAKRLQDGGSYTINLDRVSIRIEVLSEGDAE